MQPLSKGGSGARFNVVLACRSCNGKKADMNVDEYRAHLENLRGVPVRFWGEGSGG